MTTQAVLEGLRFAVRLRVVAKYLGQAFLLLGALTCVPAAVAASSGQYAVALRYLAVILLLVACGAATAGIRVAANMQPAAYVGGNSLPGYRYLRGRPRAAPINVNCCLGRC